MVAEHKRVLNPRGTTKMLIQAVGLQAVYNCAYMNIFVVEDISSHHISHGSSKRGYWVYFFLNSGCEWEFRVLSSEAFELSDVSMF